MLFYMQLLASDEDKSLFEQLYIKYRYLMFSVANKILNNPYDSEDAVHQAFLYLIDNLKKVHNVDCPETRSYIVILTECRALDIIRDRKKFSDTELSDDMMGIHINMESTDSLSGALARLPERYRNAILLKYAYGYKLDEIGDMLNCSEAAAGKLISRGKFMLRKELEKEGETV